MRTSDTVYKESKRGKDKMDFANTLCVIKEDSQCNLGAI